MNTEKETLNNYYHKRRSVNTDEPQTLTVNNIVNTENNKIGVETSIEGINITIVLPNPKYSKVDISKQLDINYFFNNIVSQEVRYSKNNVIGEEFTAYFNSDLTKMGFNRNEYLYDVKLSDNENNLEITNLLFDEIYIWNVYMKSKINNIPLIQDIDKINKINENTFEIVVKPVHTYTLK